ncbi:Exonuclease V mitochondrial [Spathaspora sp. JA1]|nr:Exonuclease V mitochondrial [Spathaspora sp. JA1]
MNRITTQFRRKLHISPEVSQTETRFVDQEVDHEIESILVKLVKPKPDTSTMTTQTSSLYRNWGIPATTSLLPLQSPLENFTPFEYYSKYNSSKSLIDNPRLSVTKMLTLSWCELKQYYEIFSGSPYVEPTPSMSLGTKVHSQLERDIHPHIETTNIEDLLLQNFKEILKITQDEEQVRVNTLKQLVYGHKEVNEMGKAWADEIISRLFTLNTTGEAREVLVHGYLDFENERFITDIDQLPQSDEHNKVLVSGVVDSLKLAEKPTTTWEDKSSTIDLNEFLESTNNQETSLILSDIKTRTFNSVPYQDSILDSAKLQTFYYKHMFEVLTHDVGFSYNSLLTNAQKKGIDIDKPLSAIAVLNILRTNYRLFFQDFMKLSQGEPIGFPEFDNITPSDIPYEFGKVFQLSDEFSWDHPNHTKFLERLNQIDPEVNYSEILLPLLTTWKTPPTIRYFAARASQFYGLFKSNSMPQTSVEYVNNSSGETINTMSYNYNHEELAESIHQSCSFWQGNRNPIPTEYVSRCKYCVFKDKCVVPNGGITSHEKSRMELVEDFLQECELETVEEVNSRQS